MKRKLLTTLLSCVMKAPAGAQPHLIYLFQRIAPRAILLLCFSTFLAFSARAQLGEAPHDPDNCYTIRANTSPYSDVYYYNTTEATHTFSVNDVLVLMLKMTKSVYEPYLYFNDDTSGEYIRFNPNTQTVTFPLSDVSDLLHCGKNRLRLKVRHTTGTTVIFTWYTANIWINKPPVASDISVNGATVCSGQSATLTASSSTVSAPVFKWYDSQSAGATLLWEGGSYTTPALTATTTYYVSVSNGVCDENSPGTRKAATVAVSSPGSIGTAQTVCYNTAPQPLTATVAPVVSGSPVYQWQSSTDDFDWTDIQDATLPNYAPGNLTESTYFRRAVTGSTCATMYSASILIGVNPEPTVAAIPNREYHLQDTVPAINFSCSPALSGVTYKWTNSNTHIGLAASGEGDIPAFEAKGIGRATITVTPYYNNCPGTPTEFVITVYYMVPVNPHLRSNVVGN